MAILVTCEACKVSLRVRDEYLDKKAWCPACHAPITLTGERVPNHEVFISYSNKDKHVADAICAKLEALPLRCWIAPRDVTAGHSWGSSIIEAIEEAKVMVLVYSDNSNLSPQVIREVERAVAKGLVLVPFRIEATMMSKDMEYFLSASHWIDALTPPLEQHLVELGELVRTVLFKKEKDAAAAQKPVQPAKSVPTASASTSPASPPKSRNKLWMAALVALVAILGMAGWWFGGGKNAKAPPQNQTSQPSPRNVPVSTATSGSVTAAASPPSPTSATVRTSSTNTEGAAITISCSETVRILPLEVGRRTFYDSQKFSTDVIESIRPELAGWQFVCPPMRDIGWYEVRVNQDGILYIFGVRNKRPDQNVGEDLSKWETAAGAIQTSGLKWSFRRNVVSGEIIKLKAFHVLLAAKSIELVHDGKAESDTQPAAPTPTPATVMPVSTAQPGQPWVNSLGMKFVPVPDTKVLFSIWDTRVQDYQAFAAVTKRDWKKPVKQGPTHPAVNVSWDDAKAFCVWLTEKERSTGTLTSSQEYRLPTDLEWSTAVGLGKETGSSPNERSGKIEGVFPWGTQWPPPHGAGNYASSLNVDDFDRTSPVGSFVANRFGLYDMGGNVLQWCEDFHNGRNGPHLIRGSSWSNPDRDNLLSSHRRTLVQKSTDNGWLNVGFRCVLANGGIGATNSVTSSDQ